MTTYAIVGAQPTKNKKVIEECLDQIFDAAVEAEEEMGFILAYGDDLSPTQQRVVDWVGQIDDLYYELVVPPKFKDDDSEIYSGAAEIHESKDIDGTVLKLAKAVDEGDVEILALWGDGGDDDLEQLVRSAVAAKISVKDLLDGLVELEFASEEGEGNEEPTDDGEEPEEDEAPKPARRGTRKAAPTEPPARGKPGRPRKEAAAAEETAEEAPKRTRRSSKAAAADEAPEEITAEGLATVNLLNGGIDYDQLASAITAGIIGAIKHLATA